MVITLIFCSNASLAIIGQYIVIFFSITQILERSFIAMMHLVKQGQEIYAKCLVKNRHFKQNI